MVAPYAATRRVAAGTSAPASLIPVTNAIEALNSKIRRAVRTRGLPWWYVVATNNAKPLLVIERDAVRFRVIREQRRPFADIACADVRQAPGTVNLDLAFHGSPITFSANLGAVPLAAHVLSLLPASVPLSVRAAAVKAAGACA